MAVELEQRDTLLVRVTGKLSEDNGSELLSAVRSLIEAGKTEAHVELSAVDSADSIGCAYLNLTSEVATAAGFDLQYQGARGGSAQFLELFSSSLSRSKSQPKPRVGFLEGLGGKFFDAIEEAKSFTSLMIETIYWTFIGPFERRGVRWGAVWDEVYEIGPRAVGIVLIINLLLGLIIAVLSAAQLEMFGATYLVANLVAVAFTRELAALMTGVVISARSGSAITAELSTMVVQEEVDALKSMGLNPTRFLVTPKIIAMVICLPALAVVATVSGIGAGYILGVYGYGISPEVWIDQTIDGLEMGNIIMGLSKAFCYALVIVVVGCHNGLRVRGGARGVGQATTRSVVMDIFFIIVVAAIFAVAFK